MKVGNFIMKKILAIVLALCLILSLSVSVFAAADESVRLGPDPDGGVSAGTLWGLGIIGKDNQTEEPGEEDSGNVDVDTPAEDTDQTPDDEQVTVDDGEPAETPKEDDKNPHTGVALAVIPMVVAAAAIVVSKRK